jgi:heat shock protein HslJ
MRSASFAVKCGASALVCLLMLAGCASPTGPGAPIQSGGPVESITGQWVFLGGADASGAISPSGSTVTLTINGRSSGGNAGCNAFGAVASGATTGAFSIRVGVHTNMACVEAERNITEQHYLSALGKVTAASLSGGDLTLKGPGITLKFDRSGS